MKRYANARGKPGFGVKDDNNIATRSTDRITDAGPSPSIRRDGHEKS